MFETMEKLNAVRRVAKSLVAEEWASVDNSQDGEGPFREVEKILRDRTILGPAV